MIVFFDASALFHLSEVAEPFGGKVRQALAALAKKHPDLGSAVSRLAWLECRVGPMKANDGATRRYCPDAGERHGCRAESRC